SRSARSTSTASGRRQPSSTSSHIANCIRLVSNWPRLHGEDRRGNANWVIALTRKARTRSCASERDFHRDGPRGVGSPTYEGVSRTLGERTAAAQQLRGESY